MYKEFWVQVDPTNYKEVVAAVLVMNDVRGNQINITLIEDGVLYDLTQAIYATFTIKMPDGTPIVGNAEIVDPLNGRVRFEVPGQAVSVIGIYELTVEIYDGVGRMTAGMLMYEVKTELDATDGILDDSNYPVLQDMINKVSNADANETTRISNEDARIAAETVRSDTEVIRVDNEDARIAAETTRSADETARSDAETVRLSAESARDTAESTRVSNEATRVTSENTRVTNENDRENAETTRLSDEATRVSAEATRVSKEATRVSNESTRETNESTRIANENTRVSNENTRVAAEAVRETNINNFINVGEYDNATQYYQNNIVNYNGSSYMAKQDTVGNLPTNITYWGLCSQRGVDGEGSVGSVNNLAPDVDGNVDIDAFDIPVDGTAAGDVTLTNSQEVAAKVVTNASNISANEGNISANALNISNNATQLVENAKKIDIVRIAKDTTGTATAYELDTIGTFDLTLDGNILPLTPHLSNIGASTIALDGQLARSIKKFDIDTDTYVDIEADDIKKNTPLILTWDLGNDFFVYAPKSGGDKTFSKFYEGIDLILAEVKAGKYIVVNRPTKIGSIIETNVQENLTGSAKVVLAGSNPYTMGQSFQVQSPTTIRKVEIWTNGGSYNSGQGTLQIRDTITGAPLAESAFTDFRFDDTKFVLELDKDVSLLANTTYYWVVVYTSGVTTLNGSDANPYGLGEIVYGYTNPTSTAAGSDFWFKIISVNDSNYQEIPSYDQVASVDDLKATVTGNLRPNNPSIFYDYVGFMTKEEPILTTPQIDFYNLGDEMISMTGGWIPGYNTGGTATKNADHLYVVALDDNGTEEATHVTANEIDLTSINKIYIDWTKVGSGASDSRLYLGVTTDTTSRLTVGPADIFASGGDFTRQIYSLDVSAISGSYHIACSARDNDASNSDLSKGYIYRIWGERL